MSLPLPTHWVRSLFLAHVYLELQLHEEALEIYQSFMNVGFQKSNYLVAQVATAFHNMRGQCSAGRDFSKTYIICGGLFTNPFTKQP